MPLIFPGNSSQSELTDRIAQATQLFLAHRFASEEELVQQIMRAGSDADLADRLMEFLPLAFGRVLLTRVGMKLPDRFVRMLDNGGFSEEWPLTAEPLWKPLVAFIRKKSRNRSFQERVSRHRVS